MAADEAAAGPGGPGAALATLVLSRAKAALGKVDGAAAALAGAGERTTDSGKRRNMGSVRRGLNTGTREGTPTSAGGRVQYLGCTSICPSCNDCLPADHGCDWGKSTGITPV